MDVFEEKLNDLLVDTFKSILKVEENIIRHNNKIPLSISELHLLEAIGKEKTPKTVSQIAAELDIALSSVTVAVNKLIKKGFLIKEKNLQDARSVYISLTKHGEKMNKYHHHFHIKMVQSISDELSEAEKESMLKGMEKLNQFFQRKIQTEAQHEL